MKAIDTEFAKFLGVETQFCSNLSDIRQIEKEV